MRRRPAHNKFFLLVFLASLLLTAAVAPAEAQPVASRLTVVIDPGHGGADSGVVGLGGFTESRFNLALARQLRAVLQTDPRVKVHLTREADENPELSVRTAAANRFNADVLISLHAGGGPGRIEGGFAVFYFDDRGLVPLPDPETVSGPDAARARTWLRAQYPYTAASKRLSASLDRALGEVLRQKGPGPLSAPLAVLTGAARPAVLIEIGNLNRPEDERRLSGQPFRDALTRAIVQGLTAWRRSYLGR